MCAENEAESNKDLLLASPQLSCKHDMLRANSFYVMWHLLQNETRDAFDAIASDIKVDAAKKTGCDSRVGTINREQVHLGSYGVYKTFFLYFIFNN